MCLCVLYIDMHLCTYVYMSQCVDIYICQAVVGKIAYNFGPAHRG